MTPAHLTTVAIRTALVENPPGKVPVSSGLVMIERGTQPNGDRIYQRCFFHVKFNNHCTMIGFTMIVQALYDHRYFLQGQKQLLSRLCPEIVARTMLVR